MDMTVKWFLIWQESTDRNKFEREFKTKEDLNDFLEALSSTNVTYYKIISGFTIDEGTP